MKKFIAFKLSILFILSSLASLGPVTLALAEALQPSCENGECVEKIIDRLEALGELYQKQCLPSEGPKADLKNHFEANGITEDCWKLITEIKHLEGELQKHQTDLETQLGCESASCKLSDSLNSRPTELSCTEPKKQEIKKKCNDDLSCVLTASAMGTGGYLAEMMMPQTMKLKDCHLGDDSCATQLATGFLKAVVSFFEGAWDLLKLGGRKVGEKMTQFWDWVSGAEDHSSTSQLALAKASEDPGVFDMLISDFPGTMKKLWAGFMGAIKEWLKNDIFCNKWSGVPHFSECLEPTESFDCISCKAMVNGVCAMTGTLVAEVVPAFLTGGLITAAKFGINGGAKIAKIFKVSSAGLKAIKNSKIAKVASEATTKVDDILKASQVVKVAKGAVEASLKAISKYLGSPARKVVKESFLTLSHISKGATLYVAESQAGKVLMFSGKVLKSSGKIILYPIENPMTAFAFKAGERSFDKLFRLGAPKLAASGAVARTLGKSESNFDFIIGKIEEAKLKKSPQEVVNLEKKLLEKVLIKRNEHLKEVLFQEDVDFNEIIRHLYPELQYGDLAKSMPKENILMAEKELFLEIEKMPEGVIKEKLLQKYQAHVVNGEARAQIVEDTFPSYKSVIDNSKLGEKERFEEALKTIKRTPASLEERQNLALTLERAHLAGGNNGVFEYSFLELREKYGILVSGGFTKDEAELLIRAGLAGRPPVRQLIKPGDTLFSGFAEDILKKDYPDRHEELLRLIRSKTNEDQQGFFKKLFGNSTSNSEVIVDNLDSLYFIDYAHTVDELDGVLLGRKEFGNSALAGRYDKEAFNNFKDARIYLLKERPAISKETLLEIHRKMMKGGVENVPATDMGVIREGHWYGNVPYSNPISDTVKKEIMDNPYLTWIEYGKTSDGGFYGEIQYPNVDLVKKEGLDLIRKNHKALVKEIEEYQGLPDLIKNKEDQLRAFQVDSSEARALTDDINALKQKKADLDNTKLKTTQRLVNAMVDDLMDWFTRERTLLGDLNTPQKLDEYVNLVSKFQRDLVSIHPLANGNGRSTRELALSYALMKEGLPPPRILDPNADIYRSQDEWRKIIKHGILSTDYMVDDLTERLKFGLPIENSIDLVTPYSRPAVKMELKNGKKIAQMDGVEYIDPRLYREIIKREMQVNPSLVNDLRNNPVDTWDKLHKRASDIFTKNNLYYTHPKNGVERIALGFVDEDFKLLFGKATFEDKELFNFKMKSWYSDDITWRGLASKHAEKSEAEIIQMFSEMTSHNASNAVLGKIRGNTSPDVIRKAALEDFEKYNNDVFGDGLVQMARDHSETGPMYGISYGYSTSKSRDVGKAFAMGAMVVGEYGQHRAPELQALLKSRVLVGAKRAHKDVDLGRLKQLREDFSYKYGRQQEVMGIGASDPDAITIVQTIDAEGDVVLSYLRNKNNPKEILVIKGDISPDATPRPEQILKTIYLKKK